MNCPRCRSKSRVLKVRKIHENRTIRKRQCEECGFRFHTDERYRFHELKERIMSTGAPFDK